ncbi:hypothetical protein MMPV_001582 [Pyropia vietnamensis]
MATAASNGGDGNIGGGGGGGGGGGSEADADAVLVVEIGTGVDLHGQDATVAAVRACKDAMTFTSLPGLARLLPDGDFSRIRADVTLGVPSAYTAGVDTAAVAAVFPYGTVTVSVTVGGLATPSGVVLPDHHDAPGVDTAVVVVAAVHVRGPPARVYGEENSPS